MEAESVAFRGHDEELGFTCLRFTLFLSSEDGWS